MHAGSNTIEPNWTICVASPVTVPAAAAEASSKVLVLLAPPATLPENPAFVSVRPDASTSAQ